MADYSKDLLNMLSEFVVGEIGARALDGITYTMIFEDDVKGKSSALYERCKAIKNECYRCGFDVQEVFRVYQVSNGYIMDMDLDTVREVTTEIAKGVAIENGDDTIDTDLIKDKPIQRRKRDMVNLAKFLKSKYDMGQTEVSVALFSKNTTSRIIINAVGPDGANIMIMYNAYALRHWDIPIVNERLLMPAGFRISRIRPGEILPSKTGVSFEFELEPYKAD